MLHFHHYTKIQRQEVFWDASFYNASNIYIIWLSDYKCVFPVYVKILKLILNCITQNHAFWELINISIPWNAVWKQNKVLESFFLYSKLKIVIPCIYIQKAYVPIPQNSCLFLRKIWLHFQMWVLLFVLETVTKQ